MRLKLLFFSMLMACGVLYAQDTIKSVVISEAFIGGADQAYVEITNMGSEAVDLLDFEFGHSSPWSEPYDPDGNNRLIIGEYLNKYQPGRSTILGPGESFTMAMVYDYTEEMWPLEPDNYQERITRKEWWDLADIQMHYNEPIGEYPEDSVSPKYQVLEVWNGRDMWYLRNHFTDLEGKADSAVIDQVNGWFNGSNGRNVNWPYTIAGYERASVEATLVRKFSVKEGNMGDFVSTVGISVNDSEWIPIPPQADGGNQYRVLFWTAGNHVGVDLNEQTLVPEAGVDVDFNNKVITVPWGVRNNDSVMMKFDYQPGLAWHYDFNNAAPGAQEWEQAHIDSGFVSARTGDTLTIWACGNDMDELSFHIEVLPPTDDANWVMPKGSVQNDGFYNRWGTEPVFDVTDGVDPMDTIYNVPYATRVDTLYKYLEKAPDAAWEIVYKSGDEKPDLANGDKLKVTAKDGSVKEYFIKVDPYRPSENSLLSTIRWPDLPSYYEDVYGYIGDTIPSFNPQLYKYKAIVPSDVDGIPALNAKAQNLNTKIEVQRAVSLAGSVADRTVTFMTTAEDGITKSTYEVELIKEKLGVEPQPFIAEPIISQMVYGDDWNNHFFEIYNPGTEPLDLSQYMLMMHWSNEPYSMVTWSAEATEAAWNSRYLRYIPGYKWVDLATWQSSPVTTVLDPAVDPVVAPNDVFVVGGLNGNRWIAKEDWWLPAQVDVDLTNSADYPNPWNEDIGDWIGGWYYGYSVFLYKITNDSIHQGLKGAYDANDFEVIDAWSPTEMGTWVIGGADGNAMNATTTWIRKPEFIIGQPEPAGSWGTQEILNPGEVGEAGTNIQDGTSEWLRYDRDYGQKQNMGWPMEIIFVTQDLGVHYALPSTVYMSTVLSNFYKVSDGYSHDEAILGLKDGVTVSQFLSEIIKKDEDQTLTLIDAASAVLGDDAVISDGDSLIVMSADSVNMTKYRLGVTAEGLSDDAVLTSATLTIEHSEGTGSVAGFDYGTPLKDVINAVEVPAGATMVVVDADGKYVPKVRLDLSDTTDVDVLASHEIYFEVTSENFRVTITYQLKPNVAVTDAYLYSNIYDVDQDALIVQHIPVGTTVPSFYSNVVASEGASIQLKDKGGFDRLDGEIYQDDKVLVIAADNETQNAYFLAMLQETPNYLAYVLSDVYAVDQIGFTITGNPQTDINEVTLVSDFMANLNLAAGASMRVLDATMAEKDGTDNLDDGDILEVVAGNGVTVVFYDILVDPTSARDAIESGLNVYPNPSNGIINVAGLESGNRIRVYNAVGSQVLDYAAVNTTEVISLGDQQQGIYFMTISDKTGVRAHVKLVIE